MPDSPDFEAILRSLVESNVRFVLIGGLAMIAQGTANLTRDVDCLYARDPENIARIVQALQASHPRLRTPHEPIPVLWDTDFFKNVLNVTLSTDFGPIDLFAEAPGAQSFEEIWTQSQEMRLFGLPVRVASVEDLLRMKLATGRPKDREHAMQLQALKKMLDKNATE